MDDLKTCILSLISKIRELKEDYILVEGERTVIIIEIKSMDTYILDFVSPTIRHLNEFTELRPKVDNLILKKKQ